MHSNYHESFTAKSIIPELYVRSGRTWEIIINYGNNFFDFINRQNLFLQFPELLFFTSKVSIELFSI